MERFGKSEVGGAVRREIVTHLPDAREQDETGIASERKIEEIGESFGGAFGGDAGGTHVAAQNLSDLQVKQMRSMQRLAGGKEDAARVLIRAFHGGGAASIRCGAGLKSLCENHNGGTSAV